MDRFIVSPCCNPEMGLEEVLAAYAGIGFSRFEVFTSWVKSAFDIHADPAGYLATGRKYGMAYASMHLPPVTDDFDRSLATTIDAVKFAKAIGVEVVLFKGSSQANYIRGASAVLDACQKAGVTAVVQNHAGTAVSSLEDVRTVLEGIADPRMKSLLEVGHFHTVGVSWAKACEYLIGRIALVHIKDQIGGVSVPFGTGEIDLPGLFAHMTATGYAGSYVVEMEVKDHENTLTYLADALKYVRRL
jgi:sugar phosphate isomerase/epimerase